jgi:hypothetical protein
VNFFHRRRQRPERRPTTPTVRIGSRFTVWWQATVLDRTGDGDATALTDKAVELLPRQRGILGGSYSYDHQSFCFWVYVDAATPTVASYLAIAGLREALLSAGIGLGPISEWAALVLDLDPRPLELRPYGAETIARHLFTP